MKPCEYRNESKTLKRQFLSGTSLTPKFFDISPGEGVVVTSETAIFCDQSLPFDFLCFFICLTACAAVDSSVPLSKFKIDVTIQCGFF